MSVLRRIVLALSGMSMLAAPITVVGDAGFLQSKRVLASAAVGNVPGLAGVHLLG